MDDMEDDERYNPIPYSLNHNNSSNRRKIHIRNTPYSRPATNRYEEEDDDAIDELDEENYVEDDVVVEEHYQHHPHDLNRNLDADNGFEWHPKKRKLKNLDSGYEFAPRVKLPNRVGPSSLAEEDWTEHAVFVLLEVWGDRFLQLGRKSLRSEDWHEVAQKVSEASKMERTDTQCRNMLDMLKRKYKKEKAKIEEMGLSCSKWAYYKKMEMLMASSMSQECGLACGVDNGEYVFMNTRVYLEKSNGFDEMRDSPGESETDEDDNGNDQNGFPPRHGGGGGLEGSSFRVLADSIQKFGDSPGESETDEDDNGNDQNGFPPRHGGGGGLEGSSFRVLADSIQKFGEIYENIESSKRQQMMELEKMRRDFNKEMELQKKQILERAQAEIAKIQEADDDDDDTDASAEDLSE